MLNKVSRHFTRIDTEEEQVEKNARLESFLLHVRNLVEFLDKGPEKVRNGWKKKLDDLWADDFLDTSGELIKGIRVGLAEDDWNDLNKYLSHITTVRFPNRTWKVEQLRQKVNAAMREFLDKLSPAVFPTPDGKRKGDFERLLDTPALVAVPAQRTGY